MINSDYEYVLVLLVPVFILYLILKREKEKRKTENNPMNEGRIIQTYVLIFGLIGLILYFIFR
ncbi:hypothetical protein [Epilithonimonas hispanica]|uniref:Uncharacterized protein n=1 Tax=Epilithonimonas hispanica TaxID=358687 RepID=A0A3D9CNS2_9FLAO|nr:hypothetical protein [Epilithonimonas hispanica]REC67380.1 hypothetical protein DRF58_15290 [Epilithonimonas hispanica]